VKVTEYVIPLGENARKRHYHETAKGKVSGFVVQLEVFHRRQWKPVVRYDSAHGVAHRHQYYLDGTQAKAELDLKFGEALVLADEDIKENWKIYQKAFLEGR
jgi:hypothetical protein